MERSSAPCVETARVQRLGRRLAPTAMLASREAYMGNTRSEENLYGIPPFLRIFWNTLSLRLRLAL
eukprot:3745060-Prymnesium_polylepis.1